MPGKIKKAIFGICQRNKYLSRQYDKLSWIKSELLVKLMSDRAFAEKHYYNITGKKLDLDHPETFDDKLWYLKLNNRDPLLTICSDKLKVREYVKECGLEHILNTCYGAWKDANDIDFDSLPDVCFFKCNHASGANAIYDRNEPFDKKDFVKRFNYLLSKNYYVKSREWNYKNIEPMIVAEKVLKDENGKLPLDYRFFCFGGEPRFMMVDLDYCAEDGTHSTAARRRVYDENMVPMDEVFFTRKQHKEDIDLTKEAFGQMKEYARILAKPFPFVRVDFYYVKGEIVLGEMTFYHAGGVNDIRPESFAKEIASWIDLDAWKGKNER